MTAARSTPLNTAPLARLNQTLRKRRERRETEAPPSASTVLLPHTSSALQAKLAHGITVEKEKFTYTKQTAWRGGAGRGESSRTAQRFSPSPRLATQAIPQPHGIHRTPRREPANAPGAHNQRGTPPPPPPGCLRYRCSMGLAHSIGSSTDREHASADRVLYARPPLLRERRWGARQGCVGCAVPPSGPCLSVSPSGAFWRHGVLRANSAHLCASLSSNA